MVAITLVFLNFGFEFRVLALMGGFWNYNCNIVAHFELNSDNQYIDSYFHDRLHQVLYKFPTVSTLLIDGHTLWSV